MGVSEYVINRLFQEDKNFILNARIDKILKISDYNIAFIIFNQKVSKTLLFSLEPTMPLCLLGNDYLSFIDETNGFFLTLKKHLEYGVIIGFEKKIGDRLLKFKIKKRLPTYIYEETTLIFELVPMRANLILLDKDNKIIDAFHKSNGFEGNHIIMKGLTYYEDSNVNKQINLEDDLDSLHFKVSRKEYNYLKSLNNDDFQEAKNLMLHSSTFYLSNQDLTLLPLEGFLKLTKEEIFKNILKNKEQLGKISKYKELISFVDKKIVSLKKKDMKLHQDLSRCDELDTYKEYGSLLYLGSSTYVKGDREVIINDIKIPLKANLDLSSNAQEYFKKYKKARVGKIKIQEQIDIANKELLYFEEIKAQTNFASDNDYKQIIKQLEQDHYLKNKKLNNKKEEKTFNVHSLIYQNVKICYGLSSFQNDYLTFTLAHKEDYFFHVKGYHGPHVIAFSSELNDDVMLFAAELSLYFASLTSGDVYYSQRKNIKKIPSKLGLVELNSMKEIHINSIREESIKILESLK